MAELLDAFSFMNQQRDRGRQITQDALAQAVARRVAAEKKRKADLVEAQNAYTSQVNSLGARGTSRPVATVKGRRNTTNPALLNGNVKLKTLKTRAGRVTVNENAASAFQGFLDELAGTGYKVNSLGGYANRNNVNSPGKKSHHAYGYAIDINPAQNPNRRDGKLITNLPSNISQMAAKYGLSWGGDWSSVKDSMHFEYLGY